MLDKTCACKREKVSIEIKSLRSVASEPKTKTFELFDLIIDIAVNMSSLG